MTAERLRIVHNPTAGGGRQGQFERTLDCLRALGCEFTVVRTAAPGDAQALAHQAVAEGCGRVAAAGGDGTVNEVIQAMAGSGVPLAVLPLGTANVLAREIGLAPEPEIVAETIARGVSRPVSLGRVTSAAGRGRVFALMAGVGFDAQVVAGVDTALKRRLGKGAYIVESLRQLGVFAFPRYRIFLDGTAYEAASVIVAKARYYAGAYSCAPEARLDDTAFHVCLFETPGRLATLRYAMALARGTLAGRADYRIVRARRVRVEGPLGDPVQGDGDVIASLPLEAVMEPEALNLVLSPGHGHALDAQGRGVGAVAES